MSDSADLIDQQLGRDGAAWQHSIDTRLGQANLTLPAGEAPRVVADRPPHDNRRWAPLVIAAAVACCVILVAVITWALTHGLGGDGDDHLNAAIGLPSAPASTDPLRPSRQSDLPPGGPAVTVTRAPGSAVSMPWGLATEPSGRSLDIFYVAGGGCNTPLGVHVVETVTTVEVWVLSTRTNTNGACASNLIVGRSTIELSKPLGARTLLHPPSDPEWDRVFNATFPPN
ncbi:MAG TPA: hypothetical protein VFM01_02450 [Nakamurella sp.]|nr:hypothetical protein [Nakamurella sp.]